MNEKKICGYVFILFTLLAVSGGDCGRKENNIFPTESDRENDSDRENG